MLILAIIIDIGIIIACGVIASNKNRSVGGWIVLGILLGLIALIMIICLPEVNNYSPSYTSAPRKDYYEDENGLRYPRNNESNRNRNTGSYNNPSNTLHKNCPYCGVRNAWEAKTCSNCGKPLD